MWQDYVIAIGSWLFIIALIPTIISKEKPALTTSLLTASVLTSYVLCFSSLGMLMSAISGAGTALCWWILAFQKMTNG